MFLEHRNYDKTHEPFVYLVATTDESYQPGEALKIADGKATKFTGAGTPMYICQQTLNNAPENALIHATIVNSMQELEAPLSAAGDELAVGNRVGVGADGLTVDATVADEKGFLITEILGTAVGDKVRGFFMR